MLFSKILFFYDENGKQLITPPSKDDAAHGSLGDEVPRTLLAKHAGAKKFRIGSFRDHYGEFIQICREGLNLKTDPWNDDGRPPTVMCEMYFPRIDFSYDGVHIVGFEWGNMCTAGMLTPPYRDRKPIRGAAYIDPEVWRESGHKRHRDHRGPGNLLPQRILLVT